MTRFRTFAALALAAGADDKSTTKDSVKKTTTTTKKAGAKDYTYIKCCNGEHCAPNAGAKPIENSDKIYYYMKYDGKNVETTKYGLPPVHGDAKICDDGYYYPYYGYPSDSPNPFKKVPDYEHSDGIVNSVCYVPAKSDKLEIDHGDDYKGTLSQVQKYYSPYMELAQKGEYVYMHPKNKNKKELYCYYYPAPKGKETTTTTKKPVEHENTYIKCCTGDHCAPKAGAKPIENSDKIYYYMKYDGKNVETTKYGLPPVHGDAKICDDGYYYPYYGYPSDSPNPFKKVPDYEHSDGIVNSVCYVPAKSDKLEIDHGDDYKGTLSQVQKYYSPYMELAQKGEYVYMHPKNKNKKEIYCYYYPAPKETTTTTKKPVEHENTYIKCCTGDHCAPKAGAKPIENSDKIYYYMKYDGKNVETTKYGLPPVHGDAKICDDGYYYPYYGYPSDSPNPFKKVPDYEHSDGIVNSVCYVPAKSDKLEIDHGDDYKGTLSQVQKYYSPYMEVDQKGEYVYMHPKNKNKKELYCYYYPAPKGTVTKKPVEKETTTTTTKEVTKKKSLRA